VDHLYMGVGVLHLVCEAVGSELGLMLQSEDGQRMFPADIPRRFPDLRLCILQTPSRPDHRRLESDARDAARMRLAAARLFDAAVPAVIVVPAIEAGTALDGLERLAQCIARRPKAAAKTLTHAVREVQDLIANRVFLALGDPIAASAQEPKLAERLAAAQETALETAFDVCLYCTDGMNLAVQQGRERRAEAAAIR
jgi:hypothetical protein